MDNNWLNSILPPRYRNSGHFFKLSAVQVQEPRLYNIIALPAADIYTLSSMNLYNIFIVYKSQLRL